MEVDDAPKKKAVKFAEKPEVWQGELQEGEELVFENNAYEMLHRAQVEWPCLSLDFLLRERCLDSTYSAWFPHHVHTMDPGATIVDKHDVKRHKDDKFPYTAYLVAGSQTAKRSDNRIYVMKWTKMCKTLKDDDSDGESSDEEENDDDPVMLFEQVPHPGCVNRIRSMHGAPIVATWSDEGEVGIYDIQGVFQAVDSKTQQEKPNKLKKHGGCKIAGVKHKTEGFALDWSPFTLGRLASGACNSQVYVYGRSGDSFVQEMQMNGHTKSVEDIQWSPS